MIVMLGYFGILLVQTQMLPKDLGSLALQSQLFGNPAKAAVADFGAVSSSRFHSVQRNGLETANRKTH
jgi:hypothetical protein